MGISLSDLFRHLLGGVLISGKFEGRKTALSSLRHPRQPDAAEHESTPRRRRIARLAACAYRS
jgi:hypothetical protein